MSSAPSSAMMKQQHKRKPLGKSTENALNARDGARNPPGVSNHKGAKVEIRRDSKTPRAGNLTSNGGAYALKKELVAIEPRRKGRMQQRDGQHLTTILDPSPVKRPDPSTKSSTVQRSKIVRPVKSTKRDDSTKQKQQRQQHGGFVAASLKRLFPSSNQNENEYSIGPSSPTLTASSTPEKDSPLITSPRMKPDPIAKAYDKGIVSVAPQVMKAVPKIALLEESNNEPTDEKRILDIMPKSSSGGPSRRPAPSLNQHPPDALLNSLVGSIVGVTSLQRMESADESEVTTAGYFPHEDSSQASMTTRFDRDDKKESVLNVGGFDSMHRQQQQSVFRGKSSSNDAPYHCELRHANAFDDDVMTTATLQQIHLPAGWQVRWSKTKQQQFWVHPDFGSTWHCPGLITNNVRYTATGRSESLCDDQKITQGMPIRHSANPPPRPSSTIVPNQIPTFKSTIHDEYQTSAGCYSQRSEAEEAVARGAKNAESLDVPSSADVSTKCFTQDFETNGNDHGVDDDAKGVTDHFHDPVEFEYDQREDDGDDASGQQLSYNDREGGFGDKLDQDNCGVSVPDIMIANREDASSPNNSLVSDGVDVAALLQNGGRSSKSSTLAAIEEYSPGSNASSSKVGFTDGIKSDDESSQDASVDFGASNGMDDRDGHKSDEYSPPRVMAKRLSSRSQSIGSKKKYVPPGPLCSLQFLEEIEKKEFDTPLWRRMKRKRSTLSSVQKSRRRLI